MTIVVPVVVPSLFQSWLPWTPSLAVKYSAPLTSPRMVGYEPWLLSDTTPATTDMMVRSSRSETVSANPLASALWTALFEQTCSIQIGT